MKDIQIWQFGNVLGSNICNLFLILGLSAIVKPISFKRETRLIEIPICLFITIIFTILCNMGQDITKSEGIILTLLFVAFIVYTVVMAFKGEKFDKEDNEEEEIQDKTKTPIFKDIIYVILGIAALKFGGDLVVDNAVEIAELFKLSEKIISVTILAVRN